MLERYFIDSEVELDLRDKIMDAGFNWDNWYTFCNAAKSHILKMYNTRVENKDVV